MKVPSFAILALSLIGCTGPNETLDDADLLGGDVLVTTSLGQFVIALDRGNSPNTCENFLQYVDSGFYDGTDDKGATVFHRVIDDFMIQGGGFTVDGTEKATFDPIENESHINRLSNVRGTIAMARTSDPDSATSQFFINLLDNTYLDAGAIEDYGYTVFGTIDAGMDVVDEIAVLETDENNQPLEPVIIESMTRIGNAPTE